MHDAWALARLISFQNTYIVPFKEPAGKGPDREPNRELVDLPILELVDLLIFDENGEKNAKVQKRRLEQFIPYNELNETNRDLDKTPSTVFNDLWNSNKARMIDIYVKFYPNFSTDKLTKVKQNNEQERYVYSKGYTELENKTGGKRKKEYTRNAKGLKHMTPKGERVIYIGKRGGKYVKLDGKFVAISSLSSKKKK
jgi:hypothetical protein